MSDFPTTVTTNSDPTSGNTLANAPHAEQHQSHNAEIKATQTKLGTGASTPASNTFLIGNGAGTSAYSALTSAQLAARISDETGTGVAVFGTSPTIGTPAITSPKITTAITDSNGNEIIRTPATGSAVNDITITNAATGSNPVVSATGDDSNVGLTLTPKGTGAIKMTNNYDAWVSGVTVPNTVAYNGNHSYTFTVNATDLTGFLSPGMRLRTTRTIAASTQSTSLSSTQYYSKTSPAGMTFTNNFVVSAWIKLSSYALGSIASRYNGTSGWDFSLNAVGQLTLSGYNGGASNTSNIVATQSLPLNKWVHVAAQLDMATFTVSPTTSYIFIDGIDGTATVNRSGTNPTALVQAGNLEIGSRNAGTQPFPGKIAQVAIYSAKVTEANILATISQGLAGTETSLISAYSFNNSINDLNANANNLTANGSAVATNADSPFGGQAGGSISSTLDYGIITSASFSTNTTLVVQVPEGCTIPTSGGVSAVSYATVGIPYGFPKLVDKWLLYYALGASGGGAGTGGSYLQSTVGNIQITLPIGSWEVSPYLNFAITNSDGYVALSTSTSSVSDTDLSARFFNSTSSIRIVTPVIPTKPITVAAATIYYAILNPSAGTSAGFRGKTDDANQFASIYIKNSYL